MHQVDIVLERDDGMIVGIEVKAAATVKSSDFAGLRNLAEACKERFAYGVVLYDSADLIPSATSWRRRHYRVYGAEVMERAVGATIEPGSFVELRGRPWLADEVQGEENDLQTLNLSCISDDAAQGERLEILWDP